MLAIVLRSFPYSHDHHTLRTLAEGEIVEIDEGVYEGLHDEGLIAEPTAAEIEAAQEGPVVLTTPVEIPADWAELHWFKQKAIAEKLTGGPVPNKVAALAVINAEVAARADG